MINDIVIPYTKKTKWQELRYALRSIDTNLLDGGRLIIVGDNPWEMGITPDLYVPFKDVLPCKEHRILVKVLEGCKKATNPFVFTNDDIYFMTPIYAKEIGYYRTGFLADRVASHPYRICIENTRKALEAMELPQFCYEIHTPMLINPDKFVECIDNFEFKGQYTMTLRSLYANWMRVEGITIPDTKNVVSDTAPFFSTGDNVTDAVARMLMLKFPDKSRWES